jgi:hypothetical protein
MHCGFGNNAQCVSGLTTKHRLGQAVRESFELSAVVCVVDVSAHARLGLSAMPSASSDGVAVRPKGVEQVMGRGGAAAGTA